MYPTTALQPGATGAAVSQLQQFLVSQGYLTPQQVATGPGIYGPQTTAAVKAFQQANGVNNSSGPGYWGPLTIAAAQKVSQSGSSTQAPPPQTAAPVANTSTPAVTYDTQTGQPILNPAHTVADGSGTVVFNGKDALVTIAGQGYTPNQLYLVSQETQQLIPFDSMNSAIAYFSKATGSPVTAAEINAATTQIPSSALAAGSALAGYTPVPLQNGFAEDGTQPDPMPSASSISQNYGQPTDQTAVTEAYTALDGFLNLLSSGQPMGSNVPASTVSSIINDPTRMGFYINALAYGGYTLQDVYSDMARQQMVNSGQAASVTNALPISASQNASTYKSSAAYQSNVANNPSLQASPTIAGIDSSMLNNPVLDLPSSAFNSIAPLSNPDSPQFRDQMGQYASATYQVALEMSQASNDSDHAKAQADWQSLQTEIQDRLGITLSDNAIQAWNQLNNFSAQASANNLEGSGLVQNQIDNYLKQQMSVNQQMRSYYQTYTDQAKESYYQNYASPTEVQQLIAQSPQEAQAWGLMPNSAITQYMTLSNLQTLFPNTPASDLQAIINEYMDPNGNFYSKLYSSYAAQQYATTGQQQSAEATDVMQASQNTAQQALNQYDDPSNPFLLPGSNNLQTPAGAADAKLGISTPTPTSGAASAALAAGNISNTLSNPPAGGYTPNTSTSATTPSGVTPPKTNTAAPAAPVKPAAPVAPVTPTPPKVGGVQTQLPGSTPTTPSSLGNLNNLSINSAGGLSGAQPTPQIGVAPAGYQAQTTSPLLTSNSGGGNIFSSIGNFIKGLF